MSGSSSRAAAAISSSRCQPPDSAPNGWSSDLRRDADLVEQHVDAPVVVAQPDLLQRAVQHLAHRQLRQARRHVLRHAADPQAARADDLPPFSSSSPVRHFSRVDLPVPFSPTSAVRAPSSRNDTSANTRAEP